MTPTQETIERVRAYLDAYPDATGDEVDRDSIEAPSPTFADLRLLLSAACEPGEDAVERLREALSRVITSARFEWLGRDVCNSVHAALAQPVQESKA